MAKNAKALFVENRERAGSQTTGLQARIKKARLDVGYPLGASRLEKEPPKTVGTDPFDRLLRGAASALHKITTPVSTPKRSNESEQLEERQKYEQSEEGNIRRGPR